MDGVGKVDWKRFGRFLEKIGCEFKSQESRHLKYKKAGLLRPIIVPKVKELPDSIVMNNLRTLGISREDYIEFIKDC